MCNKNIELFTYSLRDFPNEYPSEILNGLSLITSDFNNVGIMGSFKQKSLIFSGDIDALEIIPLEKQAEKIQKIVKNIVSSEGYNQTYFLGDIKIGHNKHKSLLKYIGEIQNNKVINYDYNNIRLHLINDYIQELEDVLKKDPTVEEWTKINKVINSISSLRWKPENILSGRLKYENETIDLEMAVFNSSTTKLDLYYNYYGKYTEITNIIFDEVKHHSFFIKPIKIQVLTNMHNNNILKMMKNIYSLARIGKDCNMLEKINPLLISPINSLNSCKSDLAVLEDMLKFGLNLYRHRLLIKSHIGTVILKLSTYYFDDLNTSIFNKINSLIDLYNEDEFLKSINEINDYILKIVNKNTLDYIKKNNINFKKYIL